MQTSNQVPSPSVSNNEYFYISPDGLSRLGKIYDPAEPNKHVNWTNDYTVELPIYVKKEGAGIYHFIASSNSTYRI